MERARAAVSDCSFLQLEWQLITVPLGLELSPESGLATVNIYVKYYLVTGQIQNNGEMGFLSSRGL